MNRKHAYWLHAVILFVLLVSPVSAFAEPSTSASAPAASSGNRELLTAFNEDRVFKGDSAKQDAYFEIGKNRTVLPGSSIDVSFSHSPTLHPDYSTLTILLDDIPISSTALDHTNTTVTDWKIDISSFDLKPGFHKLSFWAKMKVNAAVCEDPQNSSAWLTIDRETRINLKIADAGSEADLTIYPSPFLARGSEKPVQTILIVPDDIEQSEFKAAARLSQFLASQSPNELLRTPIYAESEVTDAVLSGSSAIWIGAGDRWNGLGHRAMDAFAASRPDGAALASQGIIGVAESPWHEGRTILVVTGEGDKLVRGAEILTTDTLYKQLQGGFTVIPDKLPNSTSDADGTTDKTYVLTFESLGYGNLVTEDVLQGGSSIYYPIPNNWDLNNGATLHLKYKHSKSILYNKSVMKVFLNGTPVQSVNLLERTSEGGEIDIRLDPSVIGASRGLNIEVRFQFVNPTSGSDQHEQNTACSSENLMGDWALVDKTSYFTFTPDKRENYNLDSLPFPFVSGNEWRDTTIVMGGKTTTELVAAMTLLARTGMPIGSDSDIALADADDPDLQAKLTDRNVVYVGMSSALPATLNGFGASYVTFEDDRVSSQSDLVTILKELSQDSAVMQLTESPISQGRSVLLVTATGPEEMTYIGRALSDPAASGSVTGRVVVIDVRNQVHAFPGTADLRDPSVPQSKADRTTRELPNGQYAFLGALIVMITALLLYARKIRRNGS
ncbi:cellulose biosynthesis cyclic di-GMP-binding regulatory protein BcsB [Cohnella panacarvi]|uniref:cellulose biosynthesis cyclic di-GMP-binding regulatory protein BcsB n=1 Tax=Cohnella panacarvi TaxID=400776 RepID=UPI00047BEC4C|nr:cellulose biosynthesis cyclic di-GMP-binding regulatory protein BcsB [Cohnella panacarvi]